MPSTDRRLFLRTGAAALAGLGLAGCLGTGRDGRATDTTDSPGDASDSPTRSPDSTETPTDPPRGTTETTSDPFPESAWKRVADRRVAVADPTARKAAAYDSIMGSGGVLAPADRQFVVAAVGSDGGRTAAAGPPPYDAFELAAGDETYPAVDVEERTRGAYTTSFAGRGNVRYGASHAGSAAAGGVGWIAFDPPSPLDAPGSLELRCRYGGETATWSLPDAAAETLRRPAPAFELRSFAAEAVDGGRSVSLSLTVENVSDVGGEFLAAVYWPTTVADDDESRLVRRSVPAGGVAEWSATVDARYAARSGGEATARVDGPVSAAATVSLPETTAT